MLARARRYLPLIVGLLLPGFVTVAANQHTLPSPTGNVQFAHPQHADVTCKQCHHQGIKNNQFACQNCHEENTRRDVLHKLCTDCHLKAKRQAKPAGPIKLCSRCHKR